MKISIGDKFGRLTVLHLQGRNKGRRPSWFCRCDCGNKKSISSIHLLSGHTKSCGCLKAEKSAINGATSSRRRGLEQTQCIHGHEYTPENTAYSKQGSRVCVACRYASVRKASLAAKGWTVESYETALVEQGAVCAICHRVESVVDGRNLSADHDHATKQPRGLLCSNCNKALGCFGDSVERLLAAISYLEKYR